MPKAKPTPPSAKEIEDDLAASLRILGLSPVLALNKSEAVYRAYRDLCQELKRPPLQTEVAERAGIVASDVSRVAAKLEREGRLLKLNTDDRKARYVPNMVRD